MSKLPKIVVLAALAGAAVGCAGTQKGVDVAEHGSARTDAERRDRSPHTESAPPEYWQKMR
jgi:hypothetical protein